MSLSVRVRFEVFKRDRFTCSYCGSHPPDVLLEVDHVIPMAAGGSDAMENLVTACWDCNRGKSDRLLDEGGRPMVSPKTVEALEERLEQAKAFMELQGQLSNVTDAMIQRITDHWAKVFDARTEERPDGAVWVLDHGARWPKEATVREFLRELDFEQILGAADIAANRIGTHHGNDRYFYAVCWRMIRDRQEAAKPPQVDERMLELNIQNERLSQRVGELEDELHDARLTIRRFREITGRDDA